MKLSIGYYLCIVLLSTAANLVASGRCKEITEEMSCNDKKRCKWNPNQAKCFKKKCRDMKRNQCKASPDCAWQKRPGQEIKSCWPACFRLKKRAFCNAQKGCGWKYLFDLKKKACHPTYSCSDFSSDTNLCLVAQGCAAIYDFTNNPPTFTCGKAPNKKECSMHNSNLDDCVGVGCAYTSNSGITQCQQLWGKDGYAFVD